MKSYSGKISSIKANLIKGFIIFHLPWEIRSIWNFEPETKIMISFLINLFSPIVIIKVNLPLTEIICHWNFGVSNLVLEELSAVPGVKQPRSFTFLPEACLQNISDDIVSITSARIY